MEQIFSYVSKSQYKPHLKIANDLLQFLHKELKIYFREKYKTKFTFEHKIIGSGSKKLIMKKIDGNQGFDFDYNVVINNFDKLPVKAQDYIRSIFISAIQDILRDDPYEIGINNSTSVITVKFYKHFGFLVLHIYLEQHLKVVIFLTILLFCLILVSFAFDSKSNFAYYY